MKAVILAGGEGIRLRPLTLDTPKSLIDIHGRTITEHIFDLLRKYGINEVILAVGHMKEKIKDYFKDGSEFNINIEYVEESVPLGTAGPLRLAKDSLKETFVCSNGDELKDINIKKMLEEHKKNHALITIALTEVEDPSNYGVARLDKDKILEFVEKPKKEEAPSNLINSGFYIIEPEVLDMIKEGKSMLEKDIFPKLASEGRLYGFAFDGQWYDTGNYERYKKAKKEWKGIK